MNHSRMANLLFNTQSSEVLDSLCLPNSSPSFHGSASLEDERPKPEICNEEELDVCFHQAEKKRRLSHDQVGFLEKCFEFENKLEAERKIQLAKHLGLQPRQVAIWFQNRRARYKTKVLEKEYGSLKASYHKLKLDYDTLFRDKEKIKNEVDLLREKLAMREKEKANLCSEKSEVVDSDTDGNNWESCEEEDGFPKLDMEDYLQPNSCNLGFPVQDQGTWFWQY